MKEYKIKSFEFATDLTKQLITLATLLVGISITFFEKFAIISGKWVLIASWILLFFSIISGVFALMAITGTLNKITDSNSEKQYSIYEKNIRILSITQIFAFLIGVLLIIIYSSMINIDDKTPVLAQNCVQCFA